MKKKVYLGAGLAAAIFLVNWPALKAPFIFDDTYKIANNADIQSLKGLRTKLVYPYSVTKKYNRNDPSRPLIYLTFALNYHFSKLNPVPYRLFNLFLHWGNSILVAEFCDVLFLSAGFPQLSSVSPLIAFIFALHPVNAANVSHICNRSVLMAFYFTLMSILFYLRFRRAPDRRIFNVLSLVFFGGALLSRQDTVVLPAILAAFEWCVLCGRDFKKTRGALRYYLFHWLLAAAYLVLRYLFLGEIGNLEVTINDWTPAAYLLVQPYVLFRYIQMMIIPKGLSFLHIIEPITKITEARLILPVVFLLFLLFLFYKLVKRNSYFSGLILLGAAWFFIHLLPTCSLFPTTYPLSENRLYVSGFGLVFLMGVGYFLVREKIDTRWLRRKSVIYSVLVAGHLYLLMIISAERNQLLGKPVFLWKDVLKKYPGKYLPHLTLADLYLSMGKTEESFRELEAISREMRLFLRNNVSVKISREKTGEMFALCEASAGTAGYPKIALQYNQVALIFLKMGDFDTARIIFERSVKLDPRIPESHYYLGQLYLNQGDKEKAAAGYKLVLELDPSMEWAHYKLGKMHQEEGRREEAIQEYRTALDLRPDFPEVSYSLGYLLYELKRYREALRQYEKILGIDPGNLHVRKRIEELKKL